jgi:hypothetical protein
MEHVAKTLSLGDDSFHRVTPGATLPKRDTEVAVQKHVGEGPITEMH